MTVVQVVLLLFLLFQLEETARKSRRVEELALVLLSRVEWASDATVAWASVELSVARQNLVLHAQLWNHTQMTTQQYHRKRTCHGRETPRKETVATSGSRKRSHSHTAWNLRARRAVSDRKVSAALRRRYAGILAANPLALSAEPLDRRI